MNDVRQVFDELLTGPVPPMASSEVMLAVARRTEQRRRRVGLTIGAGGLAVLTVAVAVGIGSSAGRPSPGPDAVADGTATSPGGAGTPTRPAPPGGVRNSADILDAIAAALPADHTIRRAPGGEDVSTRDVPDLDVLRPGQGLRGVRLLDAMAVVYAGDRAGEIAVTVRDARSAADPGRRTGMPGDGELCVLRTPPPGPWPSTAPEGGNCRTVLVGDVAVRITTVGRPDATAAGDDDAPVPGGGRSGPGGATTNPPEGTCTSAVRFAEGVEVGVRWCTAVTSFALAGSRAPLDGSVLGDRRLAEMAAGPALLPVPEAGR
ncbi:hypothetical protein I0C86_17535 [Plantactinospora sp. S1510]|uniref:Uncharacterized protein n=1 Tax=Plantactinospora alkalitolerans TaxID=2789879 RepID=A0ABS0GX18_9ACTN|nr:hypothetical protein [Plantactinospora alkalitolerans]MBF9130747.1 hypothetical protein [Plantactinospora alkalitolerans]